MPSQKENNMKNMPNLTSIVVTFFLSITASLHAQVFFPVQDAYVYQFFPTTNFGGEGWLWVYSDIWYDGTIARSLIEFDLTGIPPGSPVQAAMLNIYMFNQAGTDMIVELHSVLQPWSEMTVTWNNQPVHDTDIVALLPYQDYGWWHFPVTGIVQAWINNPGINHGLKMKHQTEQYPDSLGYAVYFYSRDTTLERPNLEVILMDIEEQNSASIRPFKVFPNPARGQLILETNEDIAAPLRFAWYDQTGRKIQDATSQVFRAGDHRCMLSTQALIPGVYFLKVEDDKGAYFIRIVIVE